MDLECLFIINRMDKTKLEKLNGGYGSQFYWWRKSEYPEKTTNLPQVRTILSHNAVTGTYTPRPSGIRTHNVSAW